MFNEFHFYNQSLNELPNKDKILITTLNAHSFNQSLVDTNFAEALQNSAVLIPDGVGVVWAARRLTKQKLKKIAGSDLFYYEMNRLQQINGSCFFIGSSEDVLQKIKTRASNEFPNVEVHTYSPPFKPAFSESDNAKMLNAINKVKPDVLFVGMTAPKQEKWAYANYEQLSTGHICCIGAVFDFYSGRIQRAPTWMINCSLEWLYRLIKEPQRMWKRYIIGNIKFILYVIYGNSAVNFIKQVAKKQKALLGHRKQPKSIRNN